ncbi:MAG: Dihydroorotate dehydrogenase [Methanonatronarchaeales archaeon]|nr:Dihydroorotate dehydrogenase [Methanonatronarchaeales archaeon]
MLEADLCGLELDNPFVLASGVLGSTGASLKRMAGLGAGAVVTKSLGLEPREGHDGPNVCEVEGGLLNAMGLPNPGVAAFEEEVSAARYGGVPVIVSVFASKRDGFAEAATRAEAIGGDGVELNLSCPHAEGYGAAVGSDPGLVEEIVSAVSSKVDVPVFAKLTPNVPDIAEIGVAAERGGADGLVAVNTLGPGMVIDVDLERPVLGNERGGVSGPSLHPVAVRCVYDLYDSVEVPVVGVGGVRDAETSLEMFLAGASAVQVGTAVMDGTDVFGKIRDGVLEHLEEAGYGGLGELRGAAHG